MVTWKMKMRVMSDKDDGNDGSGEDVERSRGRRK